MWLCKEAINISLEMGCERWIIKPTFTMLDQGKRKGNCK